MTQATSQTLSSKEAALFRQVIRNYEEKQYKRGIKAADQILKKNPKHADTIAMKGLILNSQGKADEGFALTKEALTINMKSHICWHVYGLLYRSAKNYEEAIKAYKFALRFEPDSPPIQRDLAVMQIQTRDYQGYIASRAAILQGRPQLRQNWTALATAHHLAGNLAEAENILNTYEKTLKTAPSKYDLEHSEAIMYKIDIIIGQGEYERALKELDGPGKQNLDRVAYMEARANVLCKLDRKDEAVAIYRKLLERNPDYSVYYDNLVKGLGIEDDVAAKKALFERYAKKFPRSDSAKRLPLNFLSGEDFKASARKYLVYMLNKGVPSTFANLKHLYVDEDKKITLESLALDYLESQKTSSEPSDARTGMGLYYLALHYNYHLSRDLAKAMEYIEEALKLDHQNVDYHMTKARILKHSGNLEKASEVMNYACSLDTKDRYINTKATKYLLRNNKNEKALETIGMFTRAEAVGGPIADLLEMQCLWFLTEDAEAFARNGNIGMALKRLHSIQNIFDVWQEDQTDFHTFSLRKGQMRAYVNMILWENTLREHPFYSRAALEAVSIYLKMHDKPVTSVEENGDAQDAKKAAKKAKKLQQKQERELAEKAAKADPNKSTNTAEVKKDDDPLGLKLAATETPLEDAMKFVKPLLEFSSRNIAAQFAGFDVYIRRSWTANAYIIVTEKYILALTCLKAMQKLSPTHPKVHERLVQFLHVVGPELDSLPAQVSEVIKETTQNPGDLKAFNAKYLQENGSLAAAQFAGARAMKTLGEPADVYEKLVFDVLASEKIEANEAIEGLETLKGWFSNKVDEYKAEAAKKFPEVTRLT
ncbi:N-alpha-acetyltransferase 16, NatA auxiliary subunit [Ceratocystis lukuohia]|uniref:N-alpha-acetyltransferase 16, NatA auxiliary subunit n=1 Tax=Ceratocystis lukuohia TaxID=2019550 RepID=A0ABR4MLX4_9PEZI